MYFQLACFAQIAAQMRRLSGAACDMPSYVYVLTARNPDGRAITYVGWTLDLERRLAEHNGGPAGAQGGARKGAQKGAQKGAKSTRGRVWSLVYAEKHRTRIAAMRREWTLKCDRKFRAALRGCWGKLGS